MRTVTEIEAEIEQLEMVKAESERKIAAAHIELAAAQSLDPQGESQPSNMGDDFVTKQIKEFNKARNSGQNPLQQKKGA
jgi:hypothetical protein